MKIKYITILGLLLFSKTVVGQQQTSDGQYFFNQYLANPALGGLESGLTLNGSIRKQFSNTPGTPFSQNLSTEYALTGRAAIGAILMNEKAGLLGRTSALATFSYHLPLNAADQKLHFGVGIGMLNERVNEVDLIGDNDPAVKALNDQKNDVDGSFGLAFTSSSLTIQGALPNLRQIFTSTTLKNMVDRSLFFSAIAYKLKFNDGRESWSVTPKVAYSGYSHIDNVLVVATEVALINEQIRLFGAYHSSKNVSFGLGFQKPSGFGIQAIYSSPTSSIQSPLGNNFELNVRLSIGKK